MDELFAKENQAVTQAIAVKRQTSVFCSESRRFNDKQVEYNEYVPGPGAYSIKGFTGSLQDKANYVNARKAERQDKNIIQTKVKELTDNVIGKGIPSVPGKQQAFGYTESGDGGFVLNFNPKKVISGIGQDMVGPGHYDIPEVIDPNRMRGMKWDRSGSAKLLAMDKGVSTTNKIGPGAYNPKSAIEPSYKYRLSSCFASGTPRKFFDKENMSLASKKTGFTMNEEEEEEEYLKDAVPGPGYYYNPEAVSSFKKTQKPREFQIFGSGSERFPAENKAAKSDIGPGKYHKDGGSKLKSYNRNLRRAPFTSGDRRFKTTNKLVKEMPGPGTYENEHTLKNVIDKKVVNSNDKPFNHTSIRFQNLYGMNENPGPGAYFDEKNQIIIEGDDEVKNSYQFKSNVARKDFGGKDHGTSPPVGLYDLDMYNIAHEPKFKIDENKELIGNKPPFNSNAPRFRAPVQDQVVGQDEDEEAKLYKIFSEIPTIHVGSQN